MDVFLSWAGERSKYVAKTLNVFLRKNLQALKPWLSVDIEKGEVWDESIHKALSDSMVGIICLTSDALNSKYLHYEAGAIAANHNTKVCTFLFEVEHTEVTQPLSRFQHTICEKNDVFKLVKMLNTNLAKLNEVHLSDNELEANFEMHWQWLQIELDKTPAIINQPKKRSVEEMTKEILESVRTIDNTVTETKYLLTKNDYDLAIEKLDALAKDDPWAFTAVCNKMVKLHKEYINNTNTDYNVDYSPKQIGFSGISFVIDPPSNL